MNRLKRKQSTYSKGRCDGPLGFFLPSFFYISIYFREKAKKSTRHAENSHSDVWYQHLIEKRFTSSLIMV